MNDVDKRTPPIDVSTTRAQRLLESDYHFFTRDPHYIDFDQEDTQFRQQLHDLTSAIVERAQIFVFSASGSPTPQTTLDYSFTPPPQNTAGTPAPLPNRPQTDARYIQSRLRETFQG